MTEKNDFLRQAELELHSTRSLGKSTCKDWDNLSVEVKAALAPAMVFLGCRPSANAATSSPASVAADRVAAARLMLLKLGLDSDNPAWSSAVLDRLLNAVMEAPGGSVGDLIYAMCGVLGDYQTKLSKAAAGLIKDLVVRCFTRHRSDYESVDWQQLVKCIASSATQAQLYLALHAIPPQVVTAELADAIAKGLESTAFREEAASALVVG